MRRFSSPRFVLFIKILTPIIILGMAIGVAYTVFFSSFFTITKIHLEKSGNAVATTAIYPFLDTLKGKNILFVNTSKLIKETEQTFKNEVLFIRIKKSYPHQLIVKVEEYPAVLNLKVFTADKIQNFVINQIGYAILENTEQKDLPFLSLHTEKPFSNKSIIIEKEKLDSIVLVFQQFQELFAMKVHEGEWKKIERELHIKTEKNFYVWIDLTYDIKKQLNKLKRSLPKLDIYNTPLEYIDLRIAGADSEKVIFKRKK